MIDAYWGVILTSLPWWIAAPLVQLAVLVAGMALDETYVNRTTVFTAAIAVHVHGLVAGDVGLLVGLYADLGLIVGAYGLYTYVVDAYVGAAFRLVAFFLYSPLSAFLVILTAGPTLFGIEPLFVPALALAGYANLQLREYLAPSDPYYFGPESEAAFEAAVEAASEAGADGDADRRADETTGDGTAASTDGSAVARDDGEIDPPGAEPAAAGDSSERGILPEFMRRL
ncbi:hypothetical protein [Natrinema marinum]|uniref:hypothetical protein n=1 Tax=Natrinema marinum TaxID=2961598 RepID=UPI0020C8FD9B|nr:hypothetical protein [Natrinema marinum]